MKLLKRTANHARNAFDMSHRHLVTANFGELLPITTLEVVPDDYVELSVADLLRAAPMVTSPFLRAKQHIDVYYVPYCDIWSQFEAFVTKRFEPKHANMVGSEYVPHASLYTMMQQIVSTADTVKDVVGKTYSVGAMRLLDLLGYGRFDVSGDASTHPQVNLWRLAAYNKIWYEHYRQQYYDNGVRWLDNDDFITGEINPAVLFNFDDLHCLNEASARLFGTDNSVTVVSDSSAIRFQEMSQMRYRLWKKDLFTGLLPSTQFGNVSTNAITGLSKISRFTLKCQTDGSPHTLGINSAGVLGQNPSESGVTYSKRSWEVLGNDEHYDIYGNLPGAVPFINVLDLRKSEALQIWREAALTAGNRIADNMRAHYGSEAEYIMHESQLIGSVSAPLNISDVNSTAQTASTGVNTSLGDVAGKGISTLDDKVIKFKAKKFGVIMVMFSLLPEAEYESYGIDRMNQLLEHEDYFVPEYQDLGLEAVSSLTFYNMPVDNSRVLGYAPRYIGYKQKLDMCFAGFRGSESFNPWASPKFDVRLALASVANSMPLQCLYVNPAIFDNNFVASSDLQAQFLCDFFFDCTKVSPMSVSSLPRL